MSKKIKKRSKGLRPPLSFLDRSIYWIGLMLSFILSLLLIVCFVEVTGIIAFQDSSVVAYSSHPSFLFFMPFLMYVEISALVFCLAALEGKNPIFGNRRVRYGETPWAKDCFPLFDPRRKQRYIKPSQKRFRRHMLLLWSVGLLLCSLLAPLGLFGRDCLTENNNIITYNLLNQEKFPTYTTEDYSDLTIQAKYISSFRSANYWKFEIKIRMKDGKSFTFTNRNFDRREPNCRESCLKKMLEIKASFPSEKITIKGEHNVEQVAEYFGMKEEERQLLIELFR